VTDKRIKQAWGTTGVRGQKTSFSGKKSIRLQDTGIGVAPNPTRGGGCGGKRPWKSQRNAHTRLETQANKLTKQSVGETDGTVTQRVDHGGDEKHQSYRENLQMPKTENCFRMTEQSARET